MNQHQVSKDQVFASLESSSQRYWQLARSVEKQVVIAFASLSILVVGFLLSSGGVAAEAGVLVKMAVVVTFLSVCCNLAGRMCWGNFYDRLSIWMRSKYGEMFESEKYWEAYCSLIVSPELKFLQYRRPWLLYKAHAVLTIASYFGAVIVLVLLVSV